MNGRKDGWIDGWVNGEVQRCKLLHYPLGTLATACCPEKGVLEKVFSGNGLGQPCPRVTE